MVPQRSPSPTQEQVDGCFRIGADESINDDEGVDEEELKRKENKKEAKHSAQVFNVITLVLSLVSVSNCTSSF